MCLVAVKNGVSHKIQWCTPVIIAFGGGGMRARRPGVGGQCALQCISKETTKQTKKPSASTTKTLQIEQVIGVSRRRVEEEELPDS